MKEKQMALLVSAAHWLKNYDLIEKGIGSGVYVSGEYCECCRRYSCINCPVFEHTGQANCSGTPYGGAAKAIADWKYTLNFQTHNEVAYRKKALKAAGKEYTFLVELAFQS